MSDDADKKLQAAFNDLAQEGIRQMRTLTVSLGTGNSFTRHRSGKELEAAASLAGFTTEEREALVRWARWLLEREGR